MADPHFVSLDASLLLARQNNGKAAPQTRYRRFAWAGLAYTVLVVLFGAVVRVTGSGAGCGQHWPNCNGEILHMPRRLETLIEISHRITSGLALISAIVVFAWSRRIFTRNHLAYRAASWVLALMLVECLVGAGLVLGRLVAHDTSLARAVVMPLHLASASLLCAAFAVTAWSASFPERLRIEAGVARRSASLALLCVLALSMTGAVTALGDTLYPLLPSTPLGERLGAGNLHFLQSLRILHPMLAVLLSAAIFRCVTRLTELVHSLKVQAWARSVRIALLAQLLMGGLNIVVGAPAWLQIAHLGLALMLWLSMVLLALWACTGQAAEGFESAAS